jgi:hypothetical protein
MTTYKKTLDIINALLDRLEAIDPDYYRSDLIAEANDLLKELDDNERKSA